jgi:hypothetical protein
MIQAIGDSFTYGDELPSQELAWPSLLSKKLNTPVLNKGRSASGNKRMVKRAIDAVIDKSRLIVIGWSDCNRQEFADEIGIFDLWAGRNFRSFQQDPTHRIDQIKYMTAYDTPEYYYAGWLRQIILVQNLCKANNTNCVMFISCGTNASHAQYHTKYKKLVDSIDHSMFVDDMFTSVGEWTYGTPHGPNGHPLEQGHEIIAEKIYEHIRNKCRVP